MNLIGKKCIVQSYKECATDFRLGKHTFRMPIVPANLSTSSAIHHAMRNCLYILPRAEKDIVSLALSTKEVNQQFFGTMPMSISVGTGEDDRKLLSRLYELKLMPEYVTIDTEYGHSVQMEDMLRWIRRSFPKKPPHILAGSVVTGDAARDLESWGANTIKVGIGSESSSEYSMCGYGRDDAHVSVLRECSIALQRPETTILAHGGICEPGDVPKALALGADCVMVDGLNNPQDMEYFQTYLQKSIAYAGGTDLSCFEEAEWILS